MNEISNKLSGLCDQLKVELSKENNKAAAARARKLTLEIEKVGKEFRKESVAALKK